MGSRRWWCVVGLAVLASGAVVGFGPSGAATPPVAVPALVFRACPPGSPAAQAGFVCATATVPLDYAHPGGRKISLAVVKHPATGRRLGTLFMNPGGPGGTGTGQIPQWLGFVPSALQAGYDIVSWDPRGVGESTAVQCFDSMTQEQAFLGVYADFPVGAAAQRAYIARWREFGRRCAARTGALLKHVSTAETARDLDLLRRAVGEPSLTYIGLSYGTFLGATYANLFPDKVRALVLDGNVAPAAWTGTDDPGFSVSMRIGTDAGAGRTLDAMLTLCGTVTTKRCAFSAGSAAGTTQKFDALLARLQRGPITIPGGGPITYQRLLGGLANGGLDIVEQFGGWPKVMHGLQLLSTSPKVAANPPSQAAAAPASRYAGPEQGLSVLCAEAPSPPPAAFPGLARIAVHGGGPIGEAPVWGDDPCSTWPVKAPARYRGPWNKPTQPILVIGNTIDPSTPYQNSTRMVEQLANGHLLTVAGYGHTALLNPSRCANTAITAYILTGALPPIGLVCPQNTAPFPAHS